MDVTFYHCCCVTAHVTINQERICCNWKVRNLNDRFNCLCGCHKLEQPRSPVGRTAGELGMPLYQPKKK